MITHPPYPRGRAGAPVDTPGGRRPGRPNHDLIAHLRVARTEGDEAMAAAEQYQPNFGLKLSSCASEVEASQLLDEWLAHRVGVLKRTQARLRQIWETAHPKPG